LKKISIGSDHAGFIYKKNIIALLQEQGYDVHDYGCYDESSVDYPDFAHPVAKDVEEGIIEFGIVLCGSGNGVAIAANKHPKVRCALCWNAELSRLSRAHNDANILSIPARYVSLPLALEMVKLFLETSFDGGRHLIRVQKINYLES